MTRAEMSRLRPTSQRSSKTSCRAFNLERLYATDRSVTPSTIVEAAADDADARRPPCRDRAQGGTAPEAETQGQGARRSRRSGERRRAARRPRRARGVRQAAGTLLRPWCWSPRTSIGSGRSTRRCRRARRSSSSGGCAQAGMRGVDLRDAARTAEQLVRKAVGDAGQQIDPAGRAS